MQNVKKYRWNKRKFINNILPILGALLLVMILSGTVSTIEVLLDGVVSGR